MGNFSFCRRTQAGKYALLGEHPVPSIDVCLAAGIPVRGETMESYPYIHQQAKGAMLIRNRGSIPRVGLGRYGEGVRVAEGHSTHLPNRCVQWSS